MALQQNFFLEEGPKYQFEKDVMFQEAECVKVYPNDAYVI